jgi:RHS repeat-associated protein
MSRIRRVYAVLVAFLVAACGPGARSKEAPEEVATAGHALLSTASCPATGAGLTAYDDALQDCFTDWSWARHDLASTERVHSGTRAIRFDVVPGAGLWLHRKGDTSRLVAVELWVNAAVDGEQVILSAFAGPHLLVVKSLSDLLGKPIPVGTWQRVRVEIAWPAGAVGSLDVLLIGARGPTGALYVDDVRFLATMPTGPCVGAAEGTPCSDGNACNGEETCDGSENCLPGTPPTVDDGNVCTEDGCDPALGVQHVPLPTGTSCTNVDACDGEEACDGAGACLAGTPPVVDDDEPCTADTCDPLSGVLHLPVSAGESCADSDACNGVELCDGAGVCLAGTAPIPDDGNACTADACDPALGVVHTPLPAGSACLNSDVCDGAESCDGAGLCLAGTLLPVDDANPCTADACDATLGVTHVAVAAGTPCGDGNACNGPETCSGAGVCTAGSPPVVDDGNPCTIDSCDPVAGVVHQPAPAGTSCSNDNACDGAETCNSVGACVAGAPPTVDDGDACTADSCIPSTGVVHSPIPNCGVLPPDPVTVAPPNDPTVATDIASATAFLYTGSNPIQTDVAPGTIEAERVAVIRGRALARDNSGMGGVKVTILGHSEFGSTLTRADGKFDLAVNGGGLLTVNYQKDGYLAAQRQVQVPWRDYAWAEPVVLVPFDTVTSTIQAGAGVMQVARGSSVTDSDGTRQATALFPAGTQAAMTLPDGSSVQLGTFHVRATEYTVGSSGRAAMPAELPPASAYTYAVDLSVDEAVMSGAHTVTFSQPVPVYLENFIGMPVGSAVPAGYYDRARAAWVPSDDGCVIKILSKDGDTVTIDADGDGTAEEASALAALGVTSDELHQLAALYQSGQTLWRVPVPHFSAWDFNWAWGCEVDADGEACAPPKGDPPQFAGDPEPDPDTTCGSLIECENQGLGEDVEVVGTPFRLSYRSTRQLGRKAERTITVHLPTKIPSTARGYAYQVFVAGQRLVQRLPPNGQGTVTYVWDGRDAYGRPYQGNAPVKVKTGFIYRPAYTGGAWSVRLRRFGSNSHGSTGSAEAGWPLTRYDLCTTDPEECLPPDGDPVVAGEFVAWKTWTGTLGSWTALPEGLGGWTLSAHHAYDPVAKAVRRGDGITQVATLLDPLVMSTFARTGSLPYGIAVGPDGSVYTAEWTQVNRIDPSGTVTRVAGGGPCTHPQSGIPATQACLAHTLDLSLGPDGSIYLAGTPLFDSYYGSKASPVRRIRPDGIIEDFAGVSQLDYWTWPLGDEGPALQARVGYTSAVAAAPDGSVYILADNRIRKVTPDGIIHAFAGNGAQCCQSGGCGDCCYSGDGGPAADAQVCGGGNYGKIAIGTGGSVYLADPTHHAVRRVRPDGVIERFAGTTQGGFSGDGASATSAELQYAEGVSVGPDGSVHITDTYNHRIRRVSPEGIIETVAGSGQYGSAGDGGPAVAGQFNLPWQAVVGPSGDLFIADTYNGLVRRVGAPLPGFTLAEFIVASGDGSELYVFSTFGRHLRTLDPRTKAVIHSFGYDDAGRLASVTDRDGLVTTLERADGVPTAIVAPHGQRTALLVDENGYLSAITNPSGEVRSYSYEPDGLMQTFTDPRSSVHAFYYDELGRLLRDENPAGGSKQLERTDHADGYSVSVTTALGRSTLHDVKHLGTGDEVRTLTRPDGTATVRTEYTSGTKIVASSDGMLWSTTLGPDPQFGMQSPLAASSQMTTPAGVTWSTSQAASVVLADPTNVLSVRTRTDQLTVNGRTSTSAYDAASRTVITTTAGGRTTVAVLDPTGRIASLQPPGVPAITLARDASGQLRTVTQGARVTTLDYDTAGLPWQITDPAGRQVQLSYDAAGRVYTETLPGSRTVGFGYDRSGNLSSLTPPGQPAHGFTSDAVDRLATYTPPLVPDTGSLITTYGYDADGALSQVLLPDSATIAPGYDTSGRLTSVTTARGVTSVGYDSAGRVQSLGTPERNWLAFGYDGFLPTSEAATGLVPGTVSRSFDNDFRVTGVSVNGTSAASFQYDPDSLLTSAGALTIARDPATGRVSGTTLGAVTTTPGYSAYGELSSMSVSASGSSIYAYTLHRDTSGKIIGKTETIQGVTSEYAYTPDPAGRLWTVTRDGAAVESYAYDDNGNRLSGQNSAGSATGTFDAQDRMTAYGAATYTYGPNGDLRTKTASGQTSTYSYDSLGNLMGVWLPDGRVIEYVVDGFNRRVGKKVNGTVVEGFLYDGQLRPVAWLDGAGAVKATFVYGLHVNVPEYMTTSSGTFRFIHDHLGSPRLVVDTTSGTVVQRMGYDSFGQVLADTNPGFQPFGFAGGLWDRDTGLVRFGARDYDPSVGRWTNKDPAGFNGGDPNLYAYVFNDPVNWIDPTGLDGQQAPDDDAKLKELERKLNARDENIKRLAGEVCQNQPPGPVPPRGPWGVPLWAYKAIKFIMPFIDAADRAGDYNGSGSPSPPQPPTPQPPVPQSPQPGSGN